MIETTLTEIAVGVLRAWEDQPRKRFKKGPAKELQDSIRAQGVIQPLVVRPLAVPEWAEHIAPAAEPVSFEIVAGERRWRAAKVVGLQRVPCIVRALTDKEAIEISVMENIHRDDLDVVEEAGGYQRMMALGWTVAEISERTGKSRESLWRMMSLLSLDEGTLGEVVGGVISVHTAIMLGRIEDEGKRAAARERVSKPTTQTGPLSEKLATALIKVDYLDPQKKRRKWEEGRRGLEKRFPGAVVADYDEAHQVLRYGSGWVDAATRPESHELAVHAREMVVPTWGELAAKYEARRIVVPGQDGEPVEMVEKETIVSGELAGATDIYEGREQERVLVRKGDAANCLFPVPGGEGRHLQSLEKRKQEVVAEVDTRELVRRRVEWRRGLVKRLKEVLVDDSPAALALYETAMTGLLRLVVAKNGYVQVVAIANELGVDLEAAGGAEAWVMRLAEDRESWWVTCFLLFADVVVGIEPEMSDFSLLEDWAREVAYPGLVAAESVPSEQGREEINHE